MKKYIVGGWVRDTLMGRHPTDVDYVVVGTTPEWMLDNGFVQVGASFPVFLKDGAEYALARTERKVGEGYKGFECFFAPDTTLEADLRRRDLTINAIAYDPESQEYIDPCNGMQDIKDGVIRPIDVANFIEDPLRVVRAARFAAVLGFQWSLEMHECARVVVESGELQSLTKERLNIELTKVLKYAINGSAVRRFVHLMSTLGLLDQGIGQIRDPGVTMLSKIDALIDGGNIGDEGIERIHNLYGLHGTVLSQQIQTVVQLSNLYNHLHHCDYKLTHDAMVPRLVEVAQSLSRMKVGAGFDMFTGDEAFFSADANRLRAVVPFILMARDVIKCVKFDDVVPKGTPTNMISTVMKQAYVDKLREQLIRKTVQADNAT